jgi:hypothetical protein
VDGSVARWWCGVGIRHRAGACWSCAEKENAAGAGMRFSLRKIGGVAVDMEPHVAGMVTNGGIGISGKVVEELGDGLEGGCCFFGSRGCREQRALWSRRRKRSSRTEGCR